MRPHGCQVFTCDNVISGDLTLSSLSPFPNPYSKIALIFFYSYAESTLCYSDLKVFTQSKGNVAKSRKSDVVGMIFYS